MWQSGEDMLLVARHNLNGVTVKGQSSQHGETREFVDLRERGDVVAMEIEHTQIGQIQQSLEKEWKCDNE